jgi:DNA replicative helicase MCM subunit Mcm2 (Cdc46/Mcm family)
MSDDMTESKARELLEEILSKRKAENPEPREEEEEEEESKQRVVLSVRVPPKLLEEVDKWARKNLHRRSKAAAILLCKGLGIDWNDVA